MGRRFLPENRLQESRDLESIVPKRVEVLKVGPRLKNPVRLRENQRDEKNMPSPPREERLDLEPGYDIVYVVGDVEWCCRCAQIPASKRVMLVTGGESGSAGCFELTIRRLDPRRR